MTTIFDNLIVNNTASISSLNFTRMNCSSLTVNNFSGTNTSATTLTSPNLYATTLTSTNLYATPLTSTNLYANTLTCANLYATPLTSANLYATTLTSPNLYATTLTSPNLYATTLTSTNLYATTLTSANLYATMLTSTNLYTTTLTSSNLYATTLTSANLYATNLYATNLYATNLNVKNTLTIKNFNIICTNDSITFGFFNSSAFNNLGFGRESVIGGTGNIGLGTKMKAGINNSINMIGIGGNGNFEFSNGICSNTVGLNNFSFTSTGQNNTLIGGRTFYASNSNNSTIIGFSAGSFTNVNSVIAIATFSVLNADQISLGTSAYTMNIQGGMNYKVGTTISSTTPITSPTPQFFVIENSTSAITITLPTLKSGAFINFKRGNSSTGNIIFSYATSVIIPTNSITPSTTTPTYDSTSYNFSFISDGTYWYEII